MKLRTHGTFAAGLVYFNQGAYWEAHEVWEQSWRVANEPYKTLYRGLIQAAAALVHWQRGNPRGLTRNWYKARPLIIAIAPIQQDLVLYQFVAVMDQLVITGSTPSQIVSIFYYDDISTG